MILANHTTGPVIRTWFRSTYVTRCSIFQTSSISYICLRIWQKKKKWLFVSKNEDEDEYDDNDYDNDDDDDEHKDDDGV